jgi:hypothetical protein
MGGAGMAASYPARPHSAQHVPTWPTLAHCLRHNARMTIQKPHLDRTAVSILLACCLFWGLQQVLVKSIMDEVAPLFQASLRCAGACALLLVWCRWRGVGIVCG